jgi:ABC-type glycerol-3-phosphate transport system permease component
MQITGRANILKQANHFLTYLVLIVVGMVVIVPLFALAVTSIKQLSEYNVWPIQIFPKTPQWENYLLAFTEAPLLRVALRTGALGIVYAVIVTFTSSLIGFGFARYPVKGNRLLFFIVVALMIIPYIVILIPQFILYSKIGIYNTYWPWILAALAGNSFYIFLFRQFFLSFPKELEDAAEVDGATAFRIYWQVFMPNTKPVIAAVLVFAFTYIWGDYMMPLILLTDEHTLLAVKLATSYTNPQGVWLIPISMAANVVYLLPMVVIFALAQKHIIKGVITSGLKG